MNVERYLGLDVGERRIGMALGESGARLATPLTTIQAHPPERALEQIARLVREHHVHALVLGLPLTLRGEVGPQAQSVQLFAERLGAAIDLPIHFFDERLTSAAADQLLRDMGVKPEKRKLQRDQVAASIILQDFLDQRCPR